MLSGGSTTTETGCSAPAQGGDFKSDLRINLRGWTSPGDFSDVLSGKLTPATYATSKHLRPPTASAKRAIKKRSPLVVLRGSGKVQITAIWLPVAGALSLEGACDVLLCIYVTQGSVLVGSTWCRISTTPNAIDKASDYGNSVSFLNNISPQRRLWRHLQALVSSILSPGLKNAPAASFRCYFSAPFQHPHFILFNSPNTTSSLHTPFNFLRYTGPKLLRKARKILLDDQGYHITHIGQGAFAGISRVLYKPTGEVRVMKRIAFDETGLAKYLAKNEIHALKEMKGCIWFPPLLNDFADNGEYVITMPYYHRGDLATFIEQRQVLGRDVAQFYCAQLLLAIQSLHKHGIVHRDIKTDNIFLDNAGHLILADLGLAENIASIEGGEDTIKEQFPAWMAARAVGGDKFPFLWADETNPFSLVGVAGTFWYTAPEVFRKERYSFGVDYWSLGVIYHELITGHIPFEGYDQPYPDNKRPALDFGRKPGQLKDIETWEEREVAQILSPSPSMRPQTVHDMKNMQIFYGVDWQEMSKKRIPPPLLSIPLKEDNLYTRSFRLK